MLEHLNHRTLADVALEMGVHPLELARLLGHAGVVPPRMRFTEADVARVRALAGIETWWAPAELQERAEGADRALLLRQGLIKKLVERDVVGDRTTRADNLARGLAGADEAVLRKVVNDLIVEGLLQSRASWQGLHISIAPEHADSMAQAAGLPRRRR